MGVGTHTRVAASTAAVGNRFVASTNMKVGAYTVANASPAWGGGCRVTVTHTQVGGVTDTLGTIVVTGRDLAGQAISETLTPSSGATVTGTRVFRTVESVTGVGWVIDTGNDTITVGCAEGCYCVDGAGTLERVVVNATAAEAVTLADARGTIATLKASIAEGSYGYGVAVSGWLRVSTTSTNDLTIVHSPSLPGSYAMS